MDSYQYGNKKERFSQLSNDPDSTDYVEIKGYKIQKAEDGTAYIRGKNGKVFNGDTATKAINAASRYEKREQLRQKAAKIRNSVRNRNI